MHPVIAKTFGGLSAAYYMRQLFFGSMFPAFVLLMLGQREGGPPVHLAMVLMLVVNTLLYPYARFVYESIVRFIMGENAFLVNAVLWLAIKVVTMLFCWILAIFIAPIGLTYLYFHHSEKSH